MSSPALTSVVYSGPIMVLLKKKLKPNQMISFIGTGQVMGKPVINICFNYISTRCSLCSI